MPNWTENWLTVSGKPEDVSQFLADVKSEDSDFDFERITPMPELLRHTSSPTDRGYIIEAYGMGFEPDSTRPFTEAEEAELERIGVRNWYDWAIKYWGTKWDARYVEVEQRGGTAEIKFDTAWCAPLPIIEKVKEKYPNLEIKWLARDEDRDNDAFYEC